MFCYNCGGEIKEGARFCPKCGAPAKSAEELSSVRVSPEASTEKKSTKPRRKAGIVITICVAAVLVLGTAAGALVYMNTGSRPVDRLLSQGAKYLSDKDYEKAADTFTKVIDKDPENTDAYLGLADAYIGLDDMEEAMDTLNAGLAETNGAARLENKLEDLKDELVDDWMDEAEELVGDGEYKDAISLLEQAVSLQPDNTDAVLDLADAYWLADRADDMEEAVLCGIETVPDNGELYLFLADYYIANDDVQAAVDLLWAGYDATGSQAMMDKIEELEAAEEPEEAGEQAPDEPDSGITHEIGFYDPSFNYYENSTYKFVYVTQHAMEVMDRSFQEWAYQSNVEYTSAYCYDEDEFIATIEMYAVQGYDGFLIDADESIYPIINDLMNELGLPWMSCQSEALDINGNRCNPFVGVDNYEYGRKMAQYVIDYQRKNWPDAAAEEVGMISTDYSLIEQIHTRTEGAIDVFLKNGYSSDNIYVVDADAGSAFTEEGGFDLAGAVFAANPQIEYWLVCAFFDGHAEGAARAAEAAGIADNCVVTCCGGSSLISAWDAGGDSCWKSAVYLSPTLYTEPMFFALYAFVNGDATPETLWPEWIDTAGGYKYACYYAPLFVIEKDNYKEYLEWADAYSGINASAYDADYHGTQFSIATTPGF